MEASDILMNPVYAHTTSHALIAMDQQMSEIDSDPSSCTQCIPARPPFPAAGLLPSGPRLTGAGSSSASVRTPLEAAGSEHL